MYTLTLKPDNTVIASTFYEDENSIIGVDEVIVDWSSYVNATQELELNTPLIYVDNTLSIAGAPTAYSSWVNFEWVTDSIKIQNAQDEIWTKIKNVRDYRKSSGVKVGDYWFHSDSESRIQQLGLVIMGANIPPNLMWKTLTGVFIVMTPTLAPQIFSATSSSDVAIFTIAEQHRAAMLASPDPLNYDYTTGWPPMFGE